MMKEKICFIAQFPPPIHGLSKAVETAYTSRLSKEFELEKVDITNNKKFIQNLIKIGKSKANLFYFTISQTRGGNLRDLVILKLLELQGKKCLVHLHGGYYRHLVDHELSPLQRKLNYEAVKKLAGVIVLGPSLKPIFQGMIDDKKIYTVPNCVDDKYLISYDEFEEKLQLISKRKIKHVLYLSNFIKSKGYPEVLEMARLEKERVSSGKEREFHFDFAGQFFEKDEEDYFWNYVSDHQLDDYITYYGIVNGEKKRNLLKMCDVFVLLTRYPKEGQPISILEAMGNGLVIVTTDHAGIPDIVTNHEEGLVFRSTSIIDVSEVMSQLREIDFVHFMRKGKKKVEEKYKEENYIGALSELFRTL